VQELVLVELELDLVVLAQEVLEPVVMVQEVLDPEVMAQEVLELGQGVLDQVGLVDMDLVAKQGNLLNQVMALHWVELATAQVVEEGFLVQEQEQSVELAKVV